MICGHNNTLSPRPALGAMPPRAEAAASEAGAVSLSGAIAARPADVARAGAGAGGGGSLDGDVRRPSEAKSEVRAPSPRAREPGGQRAAGRALKHPSRSPLRAFRGLRCACWGCAGFLLTSARGKSQKKAGTQSDRRGGGQRRPLGAFVGVGGARARRGGRAAVLRPHEGVRAVRRGASHPLHSAALSADDVARADAFARFRLRGCCAAGRLPARRR